MILGGGPLGAVENPTVLLKLPEAVATDLLGSGGGGGAAKRRGGEVFARRAKFSPLPASQAEQQAAEFEARRLAGDAARAAVARATAAAALSLQNESNAAPDAGAVGARLGEQLLALQQSALQQSALQAELQAQAVEEAQGRALEASRALEVQRALEARSRDEEQALLMTLIEFA